MNLGELGWTIPLIFLVLLWTIDLCVCYSGKNKMILKHKMNLLFLWVEDAQSMLTLSLIDILYEAQHN